MEFLENLQTWIKETAIYNDFLVNMPAPLNNIYFDTILLAILLMYCIYRIVDGVQMSKRHRAVKERQLELKEKSAENEIHMINHEREARNQREEMNQFMRFMEMSMLAGTAKQMQTIEQQPQTFEQFKEREQRAQVEVNRQRTQEAFDTLDADISVVEETEKSSVPVVSPYDVAMTEYTRLENERLMEELNILRMEKVQMEQDFAAKEKERTEAMARVKQAMSEREKAKQAEIDELTVALSNEKDNSKQQIEAMIRNLNNYKAAKEKEIEEISSKLSSGAERQAEIERLTSEMNRMKELQEQAIAAKEKEVAQLAASKEKEIAALTEEIFVIKEKNNTDIHRLTVALQTAHEAQKAIEAEKTAEIEQLTAEISHLQQIKAEGEEIPVEDKKAASEASDEVVEVDKNDKQPTECVSPEEKPPVKVNPTTKSTDIPKQVIKPTFGNIAEVEHAQSDFDKLMAEFEETAARTQAISDARKADEETAKENKKALEQQLVVEAKEENTREIHAEDEAKVAAIDEQKKRALEQVRREEERCREEEERAKSGKPKRGLFARR